jgi:hypothetical protein
MRSCGFVLLIGILFLGASGVFGQQPEPRGQAGQEQPQARPTPVPPPLFFKEAWKATPQGGQHPVTPDSLSSPSLDLKLYGDGKNVLMNERNPPFHLFTGACETNCAVAFREKNNYVDLSGHSRIRWITRTSGFHFVHPIVKLADGTWLVGDYSDGANGYTRDYHTSEFFLDEVHWIKLDMGRIVARGEVVDHPNLSKVDEIGFTDMMPGSGMGLGGFTCLASIEVYGKPVPRDAVAQSSAN